MNLMIIIIQIAHLLQIMRNANRQIRASLENASLQNTVDFSFLLFINSSYDASLRNEQIINELYGKVNLISYDDKIEKPCYGFNHSLFKRLEKFDFVLLVNFLNYENLNGKDRNTFNAIICLNPYSDKYKLVESLAIQSLNSNVVYTINPMKEIEKENAYQLDENDWEKINQRLEKLDLKYTELEEIENFFYYLSPRIQILSRKYQKHLIPFPMNELKQFTIRSEILNEHESE